VRQLGLTTWIVLGLCALVGAVAVATTVVVIVRLNRQVLASAAELRSVRPPTTAAVEGPRAELVQYAASLASIERQWARSVAEFRLRYPGNDALYESVATAQVVQAINQLKRPAPVSALHERWAQAWSDRDAALALLARPSVAEADRQRAAELARKAEDDLRRVRNELRDFLVAQGVSEQEVAARVTG
jgi:hypothetical protein